MVQQVVCHQVVCPLLVHQVEELVVLQEPLVLVQLEHNPEHNPELLVQADLELKEPVVCQQEDLIHMVEWVVCKWIQQ